MTHANKKYFVALNGNDRWSGSLPVPNRSRTDGPFKTVERAHKAVRSGKNTARVILRGGIHALQKPLVFLPNTGVPEKAKGGGGKSAERKISYEAFEGEQPVLSGGRRITGWRVINKNGRKMWTVALPEVKAGRWSFTQLWVNGRRAPRPRLPRKGYFRTLPTADILAAGRGTTGQDRFSFAKGDIASWKNISDVEFVALHYWIESRIPVMKVNLQSNSVRLARKTLFNLVEGNHGAPYFMDNVWEAFDEPGQWYLDRPNGLLCYLPLKGENPSSSEVYAPVLKELVVLAGDAKRERFVQNVIFDGLTFAHTELGARGVDFKEPSIQAGFHLPGAIIMRYARNCTVQNCRIEHVGSYGIELLEQCLDIHILRNVLTDLAGGGIKVWHTCRRTTIADNVIRDGGRRFNQAVGVLIGKSSGNKVLHNRISDFDYSGISVGWTWHHEESQAYGNIIEYNHIHDIGRGMLSDLAGIYTLGVCPGTRIRHNVIHDVRQRNYGGEGIYLDGGSSDILVENNLVYDVSGAGYFPNVGRDNIFRNNIVAWCGEYLVKTGSILTNRLVNNIFFGKVSTALCGDWLHENILQIDRNFYFHTEGKPLTFGGRLFSAWQRLGFDRHSRVADPRFVNASRRDFRLRPDSPVFKMGFIPFDFTLAGPRRAKDIFQPACESSTAFVRTLQVSDPRPATGDLSRLPYPRDLKTLKLKQRTFPGNFCSLRKEMLSTAPHSAIVFFGCGFSCAAAMRLNVCVGYDGPLKVWVDGIARFIDPRGTNPARPDKANIPVNVRAGAHQVLIALDSNHGKADGIFLRLTWRVVGSVGRSVPQILEECRECRGQTKR